MKARGQLWSLDVVLAAVVFTLALGVILSQSELRLFYSQQEDQSLDLWNAAVFSANMLASRPDVHILSPSLHTIRCGPNFSPSGFVPGDSWISDNDLSWLENCLINPPVSLSSSSLGVPSGYSFSIAGNVFSGVPGVTIPWGSGIPTNPPAGESYYTFSRKMLVFPTHESASTFRQCMDGLCGEYVTDLNITVWRSP